MKKNWLILSILGVIVFIATLVIRFPAVKVAELIQENVLSGMHWQSVSGTVFDAYIEGLVLSLQNNRELYIEDLELDTSLPAVLTGQISSVLNASSQDSFINGKIKLGLNGWSLSDLSGEIKLANLYTVIPELELLEARGDLNISAPSLSGDYHALPNSGFVTITINGLQLGVIIDRQHFGTYTLSVSTNEYAAYIAELDTLYNESLFIIEGDGLYNPTDKTINFKGQAWVSENTPDEIKGLLSLLGEIRDGRVLIDWQQAM